MTDREPGAPGDEPTRGKTFETDLEPEATEVQAIAPEAETDAGGGVAAGDDEMAAGDEVGVIGPNEADIAAAAADVETDEGIGDDEELDDEIVDARGAAGGGAAARPERRFGGRLGGPAVASTPSERAVHIDDRVSQIFVIAVALTFVGIFLFAIVAGKGGFLTPLVSPSPSVEVSESPSASPSESPSGSPGASTSSSPGASSSGGSASPSTPASASPSPS